MTDWLIPCCYCIVAVVVVAAAGVFCSNLGFGLLVGCVTSDNGRNLLWFLAERKPNYSSHQVFPRTKSRVESSRTNLDESNESIDQSTLCAIDVGMYLLRLQGFGRSSAAACPPALPIDRDRVISRIHNIFSLSNLVGRPQAGNHHHHHQQQ